MADWATLNFRLSLASGKHVLQQFMYWKEMERGGDGEGAVSEERREEERRRGAEDRRRREKSLDGAG